MSNQLFDTRPYFFWKLSGHFLNVNFPCFILVDININLHAAQLGESGFLGNPKPSSMQYQALRTIEKDSLIL